MKTIKESIDQLEQIGTEEHAKQLATRIHKLQAENPTEYIDALHLILTGGEIKRRHTDGTIMKLSCKYLTIHIKGMDHHGFIDLEHYLNGAG